MGYELASEWGGPGMDVRPLMAKLGRAGPSAGVMRYEPTLEGGGAGMDERYRPREAESGACGLSGAGRKVREPCETGDVTEVGDIIDASSVDVETYVDAIGSVVDVSDRWWLGVAGKEGTARSSWL
jgi:hypothetical protein